MSSNDIRDLTDLIYKEEMLQRNLDNLNIAANWQRIRREVTLINFDH